MRMPVPPEPPPPWTMAGARHVWIEYHVQHMVNIVKRLFGNRA